MACSGLMFPSRDACCSIAVLQYFILNKPEPIYIVPKTQGVSSSHEFFPAFSINFSGTSHGSSSSLNTHPVQKA